jgi:hypothetical protein
MSLKNLHNPQAASEMWEGLRSSLSTKYCMSPDNDHSGRIVSAHTLSRASVLEKISENGHVYAPLFFKSITHEKPPMTMEHIGISDVSVFNGFCAKHDAELFSCLENVPFQFSRKQLFMLTYRAAAMECYRKNAQSETAPKLEQIQAIHGITEELYDSEEFLARQESVLKGAEEISALKSKLDYYLVDENWNRLVSYAILFPDTPCLAACFVFQPFHDLDGLQLQDYGNLDEDMSHLAITVMPYEMGTAAIFSWIDSSNNAPRRFFESIQRSPNLTAAVIHIAIDNSENFALQPSWYDALPQATKNYLQSRMDNLEGSITYYDRGRPENSAPFLADWGNGIVTQF